MAIDSKKLTNLADEDEERETEEEEKKAKDEEEEGEDEEKEMFGHDSGTCGGCGGI